MRGLELGLSHEKQIWGKILKFQKSPFAENQQKREKKKKIEKKGVSHVKPESH